MGRCECGKVTTTTVNCVVSIGGDPRWQLDAFVCDECEKRTTVAVVQQIEAQLVRLAASASSA